MLRTEGVGDEARAVVNTPSPAAGGVAVLQIEVLVVGRKTVNPRQRWAPNDAVTPLRGVGDQYLGGSQDDCYGDTESPTDRYRRECRTVTPQRPIGESWEMAKNASSVTTSSVASGLPAPEPDADVHTCVRSNNSRRPWMTAQSPKHSLSVRVLDNVPKTQSAPQLATTKRRCSTTKQLISLKQFWERYLTADCGAGRVEPVSAHFSR